MLFRSQELTAEEEAHSGETDGHSNDLGGGVRAEHISDPQLKIVSNVVAPLTEEKRTLPR